MDKLSFICFSQNNWEKRRARKQQFMLHLSLREDVDKVLYVEPPLNLFRPLFFPISELRTKENRKRWLRALRSKIEPLPDSKKLFIFTPIFLIPFSFRFQFIYDLNRYISFLSLKSKIRRLGFNNVVLWLYHPFDYCLLGWFKAKVASCFDWAENWAEYFTELPPEKREYIAGMEDRMVKETDVVFVVSKLLLERALRINNNSYQILDGTIPEIFFNYDGAVPDEMKNMPHPVVGYTGTVYKRVDIDLIRELSEKLPRASIILLGNVLLSPGDMTGINESKNVFFLGGRDYNELPRYMMNFDVCILPYITSSVNPSPTKMYDYLATGKPIISTSIPEIEGFKNCIKIAGSREEFIEFVKESLRENSPELQKMRKRKAKENSWLSRTDEIMDIIMRTIKGD